jgi:putative transposase
MKRHSVAEISIKIERAQTLEKRGLLQSEICKELGISVMTYHRWRKQLTADQSPSSRDAVIQAKGEVLPSGLLGAEKKNVQISQLRLENQRLRKLVTDLLLEKMHLEEMINEKS